MNLKDQSGQQLNKSHPLEVNGVQFQTEIQSVIKVPFFSGTSTSVKLGIRVINNTSNRLYFKRLGSLEPLPTLINSIGNPIEIDVDMWRGRVKGKPYYSVAPGESEFFCYESYLQRGFFRPPVAWSIFSLQLKIYNEAGGFYYFQGFQRGTYRLQLFYSGFGQLPSLSSEEKASGRLWIGTVTLPFVEFNLNY